jgi:hypothetical protein
MLERHKLPILAQNKLNLFIMEFILKSDFLQFAKDLTKQNDVSISLQTVGGKWYEYKYTNDFDAIEIGKVYGISFGNCIMFDFKTTKNIDSVFKSFVNQYISKYMTSQMGIFEGEFNFEKLAKTLKISIKDAELLQSEGKTYVFAQSEDGNVYELYHGCLFDGKIETVYVGIATPERIAEFKPSQWQSAPYAGLVGQTSNNNHFVC